MVSRTQAGNGLIKKLLLNKNKKRLILEIKKLKNEFMVLLTRTQT